MTAGIVFRFALSLSPTHVIKTRSVKFHNFTAVNESRAEALARHHIH